MYLGSRIIFQGNYSSGADNILIISGSQARGIVDDFYHSTPTA